MGAHARDSRVVVLTIAMDVVTILFKPQYAIVEELVGDLLLLASQTHPLRVPVFP